MIGLNTRGVTVFRVSWYRGITGPRDGTRYANAVSRYTVDVCIDVVTAQRATLTPENVDMLVFLKIILRFNEGSVLPFVLGSRAYTIPHTRVAGLV